MKATHIVSIAMLFAGLAAFAPLAGGGTVYGTGFASASGDDTLIMKNGVPLARGIAAGGYFDLTNAEVEALVASHDFTALIAAFRTLASDDFVEGMSWFFGPVAGFYYFEHDYGMIAAGNPKIGKTIYTFFGDGSTLQNPLQNSSQIALVRYQEVIAPDTPEPDVNSIDLGSPYELLIGTAGTTTYDAGIFGGSSTTSAATIKLAPKSAPQPTPDIDIDGLQNGDTFDFGWFQWPVSPRHRFLITNVGGAALTGIRVECSGGFLDAQPSLTTLAPGQGTWFEANTLGNGGGIVVFSDDPADPVFQIHFTGHCILPDPVSLISLSTSSGPLNPVFATSIRDYLVLVPTVIETLTITAATSDGSSLSVNGVTVPSGLASPPVGLAVGQNLIQVILHDSFHLTFSTYTITVTRQVAVPTYTAWATAAGLAGAGADPLASPHHDGVANLLKYAFNLNGTAPDGRVLVPGTGGVAGLPSITLDQSGATALLRFEYLRRKNSGLTYTPFKSVDLTHWLPLAATPVVSGIPTAPDWERIIIAEACDPAAIPKCVGRVVVMLPP